MTPGAFAAACARACSLTAAGPSVIQAIAKSTQELLYIFIDEDPPDPLQILADANSLADAKLVGLAHDVGAAVADLYLDRLGFHWRANGKSVIKSGSVPDMFYDNGRAGTASVVDVVAVEAKGSMSKGGTIGKIHSKTYKDGYRRQVEPHLGKTYSALTSRSNWANDSKTFRVSRPIELVVLNCWVTETNDTLCLSNSSTSFAKSASDRVRRSTL
jgi:hypothetical protein